MPAYNYNDKNEFRNGQRVAVHSSKRLESEILNPEKIKVQGKRLDMQGANYCVITNASQAIIRYWIC